jgi:predicted ArsR family transcriptional regulator
MQRDRPTRLRILEVIKSDGPQPVRALSSRLEITGMAVRQHLLVLERDGLVVRQAIRRPVGRPESVYDLTPEAQGHFPERYRELASDLLEAARRLLGLEGLQALLQARLERRHAIYEERLRGTSGTARLRALAVIQDENGFMAACDVERGEIVQRNCSICDAVRQCPELCEQEQQLFEKLLGARVERVQHMLRGDSACRYRVVGYEGEARA